ncbi:hypothetical protein Sjap_021663 [Stephania japonica]|uniref:Uncharacterized protein n=1 Tax=Stephania japonica TaxID=461633 RepID=A0AAP0HTP4_9MAGN
MKRDNTFEKTWTTARMFVDPVARLEHTRIRTVRDRASECPRISLVVVSKDGDGSLLRHVASSPSSSPLVTSAPPSSPLLRHRSLLRRRLCYTPPSSQPLRSTPPSLPLLHHRRLCSTIIVSVLVRSTIVTSAPVRSAIVTSASLCSTIDVASALARALRSCSALSLSPSLLWSAPFIAISKELGRDCTGLELYLHVHKKKHDGQTFIDARSERVNTVIQRMLEEMSQSAEEAGEDSHVDETDLYYKVVGVDHKGRVYRLGSMERRYNDPGASSSQGSSTRTLLLFSLMYYSIGDGHPGVSSSQPPPPPSCPSHQETPTPATAVPTPALC